MDREDEKIDVSATLTYAQLLSRHPDHDAAYWAELRALYEGGRKLLGDKALLDRLFPKHANEKQSVYDERRQRAFYIPYCGQIVDQLVAGLGSDPIVLEAESESAIDEDYYQRLFGDVTLGRSKRKIPIQQFFGDMVRSGLCFRRAWALVDLPKAGAIDPDSAADEERLGLRDAYFCRVEPEAVLDYERDDEGDLVWAMVLTESHKRPSPAAKRSTTQQEFLLLSRDAWARFVVSFPDDDPPKEAEEFAPVEIGTHSFGCVPLIPFELPLGLWALNKIASIAVEHFNKRNALSWGEYKSLFQFLRALLKQPDSSNPITEDARRAVNQPIGIGRVWVGAEGDDIGYVSPDPEPFRVALEDLRDLRDEMHRVVSAMAMSVDNSGAALQRSGLSKSMDQSATAIVLGKIGECVRAFAVELLEVVSQGRGERTRDHATARVQGAEWKASGMREYDAIALTDLVDDAVKLSTVEIPSPLFQELHKSEIARRVLGGRATDEDLSTIRKQLKSAFASDARADGNKTNPSAKPKPGDKPEDDEDPSAKPKPGDKPPTE